MRFKADFRVRTGQQTSGRSDSLWVASLLRILASHIENGACPPTASAIRDDNGRLVGTWAAFEEDVEEEQ